MRISTFCLSCSSTLLLAACGGTDEPALGTTAPVIASSYRQVSCLDSNQNLSCDDLEPQGVDARLGLKADQRLLLERQVEHSGSRSMLLIGLHGEESVNGISTLSAYLMANGTAKSNQQALTLIEQNLGPLDAKLNQQLEQSYADFQLNNGSDASQIALLSQQIWQEKNSKPNLASILPAPLAPLQQQAWLSGHQDDGAAAIASRGGVTILGNTGFNRLYVLQPNKVLEVEFENNPLAGEAVSVAALPFWQKALHSVGDLLIDTVSAASQVILPTRPPAPPKPRPKPTPAPAPVTPVPGDPITPTSPPLPPDDKNDPWPKPQARPSNSLSQLSLSNDGQVAFGLFTSAKGVELAQNGCGNFPQNTGVFRIALNPAPKERLALYQLAACTHAGFTQIASSLDGRWLAAWSPADASLYLLNGSDLRERLRIKAHGTAEKLVMSPGGRYAALVSTAYMELFDLTTGQKLAELNGNWGKVSGAGFASGGRKLVIASDSRLSVLNLSTVSQPRLDHVFDTGAEIKAIDISADGQTIALASSDLRVRLLQLDQRRWLLEHKTSHASDLIALQAGRLVFGSKQLRNQNRTLDNTMSTQVLSDAQLRWNRFF